MATTAILSHDAAAALQVKASMASDLRRFRLHADDGAVTLETLMETLMRVFSLDDGATLLVRYASFFIPRPLIPNCSSARSPGVFARTKRMHIVKLVMHLRIRDAAHAPHRPQPSPEAKRVHESSMTRHADTRPPPRQVDGRRR